MAEPLRTPLYDEHVSLGARMVEFGGWMMPVQYTKGIIEEHKAVRSGVGIFDTCHMGEFVLNGPDAADLANVATTNNVAALGRSRRSTPSSPTAGRGGRRLHRLQLR